MEVHGMRTLLRTFFCALVIAAVGGCGSGEKTTIPAKFAPMPKDSDIQAAPQSKTPITLPDTRKKSS
jgi:hypothetical protein